MVRNELNCEHSWDEPERASWQEGRMEGRLQVKRRKDEVGGEAEQEEGRHEHSRDSKGSLQTSPVAQWLGICLAMQGMQVQSLVREPGSNMGQGN